MLQLQAVRACATVMSAVCGALALSAAANAACQTFLVASDGGFVDVYGDSVSVSGDTLVVGAWGEKGAYVYRWSDAGWTFDTKLISPEPASAGAFGWSVAIEGDTIVVGDRGHDGAAGANQGAAFVFERSMGAWAHTATLLASDADANDEFGSAVDLSHDTIVVGATGHRHGVAQGGVAFVHTRTGGVWTEQSELLTGATDLGDDIGDAVAIDGDHVIVGGPNAWSGSGRAWFFTRTGGVWTGEGEVGGDGAWSGAKFGSAVAIDGDMAVIGALHDNLTGNDLDAGSIFIFRRNGGAWTQWQHIKATDAAENDRFGSGVAVDGRTLVVGAMGDDESAENTGSVYIYTRLGDIWRPERKYVSEDIHESAALGASVAVSGGVAVAGAPFRAGPGGSLQGAAVVFERVGPLWLGPDIAAVASDGDFADDYAAALAVDGDTAVIGARGDDDMGAGAGAAYVLTRAGGVWVEAQKLTASDGAPGDQFGASVAIDGDSILIGAGVGDGAAANSGAAYVFTRSSGVWSEQQKLIAPDGASGDFFGVSAALEGDTALVGANLDDDAGGESGSAYVFVRAGGVWTMEQKLTASDGAGADFFGTSVALSGDTALIGAYGDDDMGAGSGSAYFFTRDLGVWSEQQKLLASDGSFSDSFGFSLALEGDTALVGAFGDSFEGSSFGSVRIFQRVDGSWIEGDTLIASDRNADDQFGVAIAISRDTAVIGANLDDDLGADAGAAYVFLRVGDDWAERAKRHAPDGAAGDQYGGAVAISGDTGLVGARLAGSDGAAYFFKGTFGCSDDTTVHNLTTLITEADLPSALAGAVSGDLLSVAYGAFPVGSAIDFAGRALDVASAAEARLPYTAAWTLADGATFTAPPGRDIEVFGDLAAPAGASVRLEAWSVRVGVGASLTAGAGASLELVGPLDVRIDDSARFDLSDAEVHFAGGYGAMERMSRDIGPTAAGLDASLDGHFPIGMLRIGTGGYVELPDAHDNDGLGQSQCEAIYVNDLVIEPGALLLTHGCPVYYVTLTNNGAVDDLGTLLAISSCSGDLTEDDSVDGGDLATMLAEWGAGPSLADVSGDGVVDGADLAVLLSAWGDCN